MQWNMLQKCYSIAGLTPSPKLSFKKSKDLLLPTTNPEISFNFKTSKISLCWELNSLCKIIFFGEFPAFYPVFKNEHPNSLFSLCRGHPVERNKIGRMEVVGLALLKTINNFSFTHHDKPIELRFYQMKLHILFLPVFIYKH